MEADVPDLVSGTDSDSDESWGSESESSREPTDTIEMPEAPQLARSMEWERREGTSYVEYAFLDKDIQGVDWSSYPRSKAEIRQSRLVNYENYFNCPEVFHMEWPVMRHTANRVDTSAQFFCFHRFHSQRSLSVLHFQLRNLLWAVSAHECLFLADNCVERFDSLNQDVTQVLNLRTGPRSDALGHTLISTICASHGLLAVGGFHGELVLADQEGSILGSKVMTTVDSGITNGLELYEAASGQLQVAASNNDARVRLLAAESLDVVSEFELEWAANWTAPSPDGGRTLAVVGDDLEALLLDARSGQTVHKLRGHLDYSFAAAWHPSGTYLATGNQDTSARVWDLRKPAASLHLLAGAMCAVRSLRYSPCGRFLAAAEAADFVHLYDHDSGYTRAQRIEFFSEVAGVSFTPDGDGFMIGLQETRHGGFLHLQQPPGSTQRRMQAA